MTIRKGASWGTSGILGEGGIVVHDDASAGAVIAAARRAGGPLPMLGLLGGDLFRTLGGSDPVDEARLYGPTARQYPCDLGIAVADGVEHEFVAHVMVRRRGWRGRTVAVMNAQWFGAWDLGPKSHPNDGILDISDAQLGFVERFEAARRARTGTHVPHPRIEVMRVKDRTLAFEPPGDLYVDGERRGKVRNLDVSIEPDVVTVVV